MVCHQCGKTVQRGDRFCTGCGTSLHGITDTTQVVDSVTPDPDLIANEPTEMLPATGARPERPPAEFEATGARPGPPPAEFEATGARPEPPPAEFEAPQPTDARTTMPPPIPDHRAEPTEPNQSVESSRSTDPIDPAAPVVDGGEAWNVGDPVWAATGPIPVRAPEAEQPTSDLPATEPVTEVWMQQDAVDEPSAGTAVATAPTDTTPYDFAEREAPAPADTTAMPATTAELPTYAPASVAGRGFRFGAVTLIALLTGLVALASLFADIVVVESSTRLVPTDDTPFGFRTGSWIADDLADNLSIAGLLAIVVMIAGGIAAGFHWRWGAGLAGGAGLAVAGLAGLTLGLAQFPIDAAYEFARIPNEQQFTLTITRDLGYWLMVVAAALGVVLFFAAVNDATNDRRSGLNPWIAALGALAVVVAAAGPLLPEEQGVFSDNWYLVDAPGEAPAMLLVGRLVQLGLLLFAGVIGFLSVRRWGLGLAIGGALPAVWLAVSTLFELTDRPVGPGFRNPGADDMHIHGVTIIGISAIAAMSVLALIAAYDQAVRERP